MAAEFPLPRSNLPKLLSLRVEAFICLSTVTIRSGTEETQHSRRCIYDQLLRTEKKEKITHFLCLIIQLKSGKKKHLDLEPRHEAVPRRKNNHQNFPSAWTILMFKAWFNVPRRRHLTPELHGVLQPSLSIWPLLITFQIQLPSCHCIPPFNICLCMQLLLL